MTGDRDHPPSREALLAENEELRLRLEEAGQALEAIRSGDVDALVVAGPGGEQLYSLAGAERVYRVIVESMHEAALTVDGDGTILFCNERFCELMRTPMQEVLGRSLATFAAPLWREPLRSFLDEARARPAGAHLTLLAKDGTPIPVLLAGSPLETESGPSVCVVASDLTELENSSLSLRTLREREEALAESEEHYRALVELSPEAVLVIRAGRIVYANAAGLALFGADRAEDLRGRNILDLVHPDDREAALARVRTLLAGGTLARREIRLLRLDGQAILVESAEARIEYRGEPAVQAVIRDIGERRRLDQRLAEAQRLEAIGQLAAGIAHDFNNLLVGVIGNASLARDMVEPKSAVMPVLDRIVRTGEQAADLTRQLLAYAGKGRVVVEPLDLSQLARKGIDLVEASIASRIRLDLELASGLPPVNADHSQIDQVVMNLVINAAEAIGDRHGTITVRTSFRRVPAAQGGWANGAAPLPGRFVCLEVADDGCGMDEATRDHIFDPFFSTKFLGRGLGLAAVSGIVRSHGGAIRVDTAPGNGSRFTVVLPAFEGPAEVASESRAEPGAGELRGAGTVLLVDDEDIVLETGRAALELHGYEVLTAANGPEAIHQFERRASGIDLVILDLGMPGMGGDEVLPELRRIRPNARIVISSGYSRDDARLRFHHLSVAGFIQKPYTSSGLAAQVKKALAAPALEGAR